MPWTPTADGLLTCPDHPDAAPFAGHIGCPGCHAAPPAAPEPHSPGEGERLCAEAAERGLPDGLEVEERAWAAWRDARRDAKVSRALVAECLDRGRKFITGELVALRPDGEGGTVEADAEDQARKWFAIAATFTQAASKSLDTQSKVLKIGAEGTALRERQAAKERRDRLVKQLNERGGSN